jgi:diguanylate cyclase (GGDEF)-like protein
MIDARALSTIRSWFDALTLRQELIVLAGVVLFFVGIGASSLTLKIVAFVLAGSAVAYVVVTVRRPGGETEHQFSEHILTTSEEASDMKKLVFDDFQPEGRKFNVEVVENSGVSEPEDFTGSTSIPSQPKEYEFRLSDFCDVDADVFGREGGPKSEFSFLMNKVLTAIKEANFAHTAALFWINREKNQMVLESVASDSERFTTYRRRELGNDVVSQVASSGQPVVLNRINISGQMEMLGYYEGIEPVKSFVGVPVFYPKRKNEAGDPVAVLVVDALGEDAFGPETLTLLGQFTKLISATIKSYTDKYDLLLDSEVLRSIARIRDQLKLDFTRYNIVRTLAEETTRLVPWDYVSVVLFDETRKAWVVQFVINRMNDPYVAVSQEIDHQHSLAGEVLQTSVPRIVERLENASLPRFYTSERVDSKGSLMILPLNSISRCYGVVVVESKDQKAYSETEVKLTQKLVETSSWALEILSLTDVVNNYISLDETTGVAARKYFMGRMQEEVQRASDFTTDLALAMVSIDNMSDLLNRYGKEGFDFALQNVGRMIRSFVRPYDIVGRYDFNQFAVLLVHTTSNEAYLWSEKLRKNIASNIINIDRRSFSVTVSIGVCGSMSDMSDVELLGNANQVLRKAVEAGGNIVRVF